MFSIGATSDRIEINTEMSRLILIATLVACLSAGLIGCGEKEEPYEPSGPTATDNPSVGAPVGADGAVGTAEAPALGSGKGSANTAGERGR